ncbi:MAG: S8 family serine peptidase [Pseudomonadota bacterium]
MSVSSKSAPRQFGVGAIVFLSMLMLMAFQNCQSGGGGGKKSKKSLSFASDEDFNSMYCGSAITSTKLSPSHPFASEKVQISNSDLQVSSKGGAQDVSVVVLAYTDCLRELDGSEKTLSASLLDGKRIIPGVDVQAFRYAMPRALSLEGLREMADSDECIRGISENDEYQLYSLNSDFNDTDAGQQKHLETIQAAKAYDIIYDAQSGISKVADSGALPDVKIAVIDSGVDVSHPDLFSKIWKFSEAGEPNKVYAGIDATTLSNSTPTYNPEDPTGHGTHVAGLIAAASNNGVGVMGVMPFRSKIMAISASVVNGAGDWVIDTASVINGIKWAGLNGADVINLGHGTVVDGNTENAAYQDALNGVIAAGVTVVTVAGSSTSSNRLLDGISRSTIPGKYGSTTQGILTVTSTQAEDRSLSSFSLYGPNLVEIAAPGSHGGSADYPDAGLISTVPVALSSQPYATQEGTSMAGALVAGSAGVVIAWVREKAGTTPHPCVVEGILKEAADKRSNLSDAVQDGRHLNLLNIAKYLRQRWP